MGSISSPSGTTRLARPVKDGEDWGALGPVPASIGGRVGITPMNYDAVMPRGTREQKRKIAEHRARFRCTVERLMRVKEGRGALRCKKIRVTEADPAVTRTPGLVDRQFRVPGPDLVVVADFAHVRLGTAIRGREGNPLPGNTIDHSDAGNRYTSVRFGVTLIPSIEPVGDAFDNALAALQDRTWYCGTSRAVSPSSPACRAGSTAP